MLKLNNVTKRFDSKVIFDNFSYSFDVGIYIISGESGIGKTTLLRMIAGLDNDYDGTIEGGGPANVSMSFQEYRLFPQLNALENVTLAFSVADDTAKARSKALLTALGFSKDDMLLMPSEMSGGMKLRASLARAIAKDSTILLLDEPTRELNRELVEQVASILASECKSRVVLIVTHDDIADYFSERKIINISK